MSEVTIGIAVGLGVPYAICVGVILREWFCPPLAQQQAPVLPTINPVALIKKEISAEAWADYAVGKLTARVYREIRQIYYKKGHLSEYVAYSESKKHALMLTFLTDPSRYPAIVAPAAPPRATTNRVRAVPRSESRKQTPGGLKHELVRVVTL